MDPSAHVGRGRKPREAWRAGRLAFAVTSLLAGFGVACHSILGIGDDRFTVADGGADADPASLDPCVRSRPPGRPDASNEGPNMPLLVMVVRGANVLGTTDAGVMLGYDLDQACTCDSRPGVRNAEPTCVAPANSPKACDREGGIDNAVAELARTASRVPGATDLNAEVNKAANCGDLGLLFVVSGYNGRANDPDVDLTMIESYGLREPHANEPPDAGNCAPPGITGPPYPARFDGTDKWSVPSKAVARSGGEIVPLRGLARAWVNDFELVLDSVAVGDRPVIPMAFAGNVIEVGSPIMKARLVPLDEKGAPIPIDPVTREATTRPTKFAMRDGVFGGRASVDALLSRVGALRVGGGKTDDENYLCSPTKIAPYTAMKAYICAAVDLMIDPRDDGSGLTCNAISLGLEFDAVPALIGEDYDPPPLDGGCGKGFRDTCKR